MRLKVLLHDVTDEMLENEKREGKYSTSLDGLH